MNRCAGRIELVLGCMFAGKTTELVRRIHREELARKRCVILKYRADVRYSDNQVSTHDLAMHEAIPTDALMPVFERCLSYDVIGIDEGQFFPDVVEFSERLANEGKLVIASGLDGDFRRRPFGRLLELVCKCETFTRLSAVCTETGQDAYFTQRTTDSQELEVIGGADMYRAACRSSFFGRTITGEIHLTVGPVMSGKTTELLRLLNRHCIAKRKALLLLKCSNKELEKNAKCDIRVVETLPDLESIKDYPVIGIDAAENFENIAEWADEAANNGKIVEIAALDASTDMTPLKNIIDLLPRCEKVQRLQSVCPFTGLPAPFTVMSAAHILPVSRQALILHSAQILVPPPIIETVV